MKVVAETTGDSGRPAGENPRLLGRTAEEEALEDSAEKAHARARKSTMRDTVADVNSRSESRRTRQPSSAASRYFSTSAMNPCACSPWAHLRGDRFYENGVFKGKRALRSVTTEGPLEAISARRLQRRHRRHPSADPSRDVALHRMGCACAQHRLWAVRLSLKQRDTARDQLARTQANGSHRRCLLSRDDMPAKA